MHYSKIFILCLFVLGTMDTIIINKTDTAPALMELTI